MEAVNPQDDEWRYRWLILRGREWNQMQVLSPSVVDNDRELIPWMPTPELRRHCLKMLDCAFVSGVGTKPKT